MRPHLLSTLVCTLSLLTPTPGSAAVAPAAPEGAQAAARWLSRLFHRPVEASQILVSPPNVALDGCSIVHSRLAPTGATALSLRCPTLLLPQLMLLHLPADAAIPHGAWLSTGAALHNTSNGTPRALSHGLSHDAPPIVRAGSALRADWHTNSLHAELPVVALDSGVAGAEIRVRIANTNRILRARILSANTVAVVSSGA